MAKSSEIGKRVNELNKVLINFAQLKFNKKAKVEKDGSVLDNLALGINMLGEELESRLVELKTKDSYAQLRSNELLDLVYSLARQDFDNSVPISQNNDVFNSIAVGLNMLAEELKYSTDSRDLFQSLLDAANDTIFVIDKETKRILSVNIRVTDHLGYSPKELIGKSVTSLYSRKDRPTILKHIAHLIKYGSVLFEAKQIHKDGSLMEVEVSSRVFEHNGREVFQSCVRDIRERKQKEQELLKSEQLFREMTETVQDAFWLTDWIANKTLYVNSAYKDIYGQSPQQLMEDAYSWREMIHPDDRKWVVEAFDKKAPEGKYEIEFRVIHPDGTIKWLRERAFPIKENGRVVRVAGYSQDITIRKRAEKEVMDSEERYRTLFERNLSGVYRATIDGIFVECNDAFAQIVGVKTRNDVIGKHARSFYDNMIVSDFPAYLKRKKGSVQGFESQIKLKNGKTKWVLENAAVINIDGKEKFVEGTIINITELKQAKMEIEKLAKFPAENPNPVIRVNSRYKVVYTNKSANKILNQITTRPGHLNAEFKNIVSEVKKKGIPQEKELLIKDHHYQFFINPVQGQDYVNLYGQDITERKNALIKLKNEKKSAFQYQSMLLSSQLNPHFIFNALNSIQYYILDQDKEPALNYLSNFSTLMRTVLENSSSQLITLEREIKFLELYLNLEENRNRNKFKYEIRVSDDIDPHETMVPPMVIQPYVENTIIHGVGPLTSGGTIDLFFRENGKDIICEITDNGVGRKEATRLKTIRTENRFKSYSTNINNTRLDILNELGKGKYSSKIEDLSNQKGVSRGTKVYIKFPLIKEE
ncbi:PAS domain S-box protein [Crocinitomix catalasitica]|nr:PAS domain S-box protein [Crocinitomix catalasitica]